MDVQKLAKVLALAASDNETEAVHALRMARRLLDAHGVDFVELARRVAEGSPAANEALEDAVFDLRNEIRHLRCENERLKQGRAPVTAPAEPASFQEAARDAAAAIRLRAELAGLTDALELERAENLRLKVVEVTLQDSAGKLAARVAEVEARRLRVEAENRRMLHANHALSVELAEARAAANSVHLEFEPKKQKAPRPRAKPAASQYALL